MNFYKKIHDLLRQKERIVKKPQKHDANLQKNSTLYFQVGLIVCLLFTNVLLEMYFETTLPDPIVYQDELELEVYSIVPEIEQKPKLLVKAEPKPKIPQRRLIEPPIVKPDDFEPPRSKDPVIPTKPNIKPPLVPTVKVKSSEKYNTLNVQQVPIFPGCEDFTNNSDRVRCMSEKLSRIVQRKFNGDVAEKYGLEGIQRISVFFTIDKTGVVTDVRARAPHFSLEKEAVRVMGKVPQMQPGKQQDIPVDVVYSLPIVFKVQD